MLAAMLPAAAHVISLRCVVILSHIPQQVYTSMDVIWNPIPKQSTGQGHAHYKFAMKSGQAQSPQRTTDSTRPSLPTREAPTSAAADVAKGGNVTSLDGHWIVAKLNWIRRDRTKELYGPPATRWVKAGRPRKLANDCQS